MLSAKDEHLYCLLVVEVLVYLAHAGDEVLMDEGCCSFQFEKLPLLRDVFKANQLTRQGANFRTAFSQGKQFFCSFNEARLVVLGQNLNRVPYFSLLPAKLDQWEVEAQVRRKILEVVDRVLLSNGDYRDHRLLVLVVESAKGGRGGLEIRGVEDVGAHENLQALASVVGRDELVITVIFKISQAHELTERVDPSYRITPGTDPR